VKMIFILCDVLCIFFVLTGCFWKIDFNRDHMNEVGDGIECKYRLKQ
jgi:hypothetical protein